eukprot:CAMPEP_0201127596 /NCGR_PEP_ID=MMETSP0850-20130426/30853_1 /ASSEMBLY_ACC=CAM_ASM_000622 /TAXON_ID=183588 /ORGANISM="Pseudo-nitzschia fraudulenta, Strain WWA7" /LENGTH=266 /DNA_ID=CAMNT_0047396497 /DNA_START=99 /DNA_END=899 /DNA_ORIENTATION=+
MSVPSGAFVAQQHRGSTTTTSAQESERITQISVIKPTGGHSLRLFADASPQTDDGSKMSMFESEGWKDIAGDLSRFPLFSLATPEGNPVAYQITVGKEKTYDIPFFYCDVTEALAELEKTQANSAKATEAENLKLIPFPLEQAFKLWCDDKAVIIPSKASILQAGAPAGTNPIGQKVPMWACLEISEEQEGGLPPKLPIFMALDDANAAVLEAVEGDKEKADDFEVVCLSLDGAIQQLVNVQDESPSFRFIPPSKSMEYIEENEVP